MKVACTPKLRARERQDGAESDGFDTPKTACLGFTVCFIPYLGKGPLVPTNKTRNFGVYSDQRRALRQRPLRLSVTFP
jgi:hypothetical protein